MFAQGVSGLLRRINRASPDHVAAISSVMLWDGPDPAEKTESKLEQKPGAIDFPEGEFFEKSAPYMIDRLCSCMLKMKTYLHVPFKEKEKVKQLGAKWDHVHKKWYWEGLVTPEIQRYLVDGRSFEDRYEAALNKFRSKPK